MKKLLTIIITIIITLFVITSFSIYYLYKNHLNISLTYNDFYFKDIYYSEYDIYSSEKDRREFYHKNQNINLEDYTDNSWYGRLNENFEKIEISLDEEYSDYISLSQWVSDWYLWDIIRIENPYFFDIKIEYNPKEVSVKIMRWNIEIEKDRFRLNHLNALDSYFSPNKSENTETECIYISSPIFDFIYKDNTFDPSHNNCYKYSKFFSWPDSKLLLWKEKFYFYIFVTPNTSIESKNNKPIISIDLVDIMNEGNKLNN